MRLFIGIELDEEVKQELAQLRERIAESLPANQAQGVKWQTPEQLHLTLKFLGEVPDKNLAHIEEALESALRGVRAIDVAFVGTGCFPQRGPVRIIWVGSENQDGMLEGCFEALETQLVQLGFRREERDFHPHITLARVRDDPSRGKLREAVSSAILQPLTRELSSVTLFQSVLQSGGAHYTALHRIKLA